MKPKLTVEGKARLAAATTGDPFTITHMAVGDLTPEQYAEEDLYDGTEEELHDEKMNIAINMAYPDPDDANIACFDAIFNPAAETPPVAGGWYVREIGLYFSDGVLAAIMKWPETYMPDSAFEDISQGLHATFRLPVSDIATISLTVSPSQALAPKDYVDNYFNLLAAERVSGLQALTYEKTMEELVAFLNALPKNLYGHTITIMVTGGYTLAATLNIRGFFGGQINIICTGYGAILGLGETFSLRILDNDAKIYIQDLHVNGIGSGNVSFGPNRCVEMSNFEMYQVAGSGTYSNHVTVEQDANVTFSGTTVIPGVAGADNIVVFGGGNCKILGAYDFTDARTALKLYVGAYAESTTQIDGDKLSVAAGATYKGKFTRHYLNLKANANISYVPRAGYSHYVFDAAGATYQATIMIIGVIDGYLYYRVTDGTMPTDGSTYTIKLLNDAGEPWVAEFVGSASTTGFLTIHDYQ